MHFALLLVVSCHVMKKFLDFVHDGSHYLRMAKLLSSPKASLLWGMKWAGNGIPNQKLKDGIQ